MPPGVHPGSRMADLATLLSELDHPQLALALDTGHANMGEGAVHETIAAGALLATTHVHDNNGRQDSHLPPGHGTVDWAEWGRLSIRSAMPVPSSSNASNIFAKTPEATAPPPWPGF